MSLIQCYYTTAYSIMSCPLNNTLPYYAAAVMAENTSIINVINNINPPVFVSTLFFGLAYVILFSIHILIEISKIISYGIEDIIVYIKNNVTEMQMLYYIHIFIICVMLFLINIYYFQMKQLVKISQRHEFNIHKINKYILSQHTEDLDYDSDSDAVSV